MDSKPHLLLLFLFSALVFHPHLTFSACVQRDYLHIIHSLITAPSPSTDSGAAPSQPQPPNPQPLPEQQPQPPNPQPVPEQQPQPPNPQPVPEQPQQPAAQSPAQPQPVPADQQPVLTTVVPTQLSSAVDSVSSTQSSEPHLASTVGGVKEAVASLSAAAEAAIKDICSKTDYPDECHTSLTTTPFEGETLDASAALQTLIKSVVRHGKAAVVVAEKLASDTSLPEFTLQNMKVCHDTYTSVLDDFQKAADAVVARDMGTLNTMLSAAMTDYETCSDGFMEMPGASPLIDFDTKLSHMTSNCLAVATLLK